jgi:hypothetical protein
VAADISHDVLVSRRSCIAAAAPDATLVLRVGLTAPFLVNALIAWVDPDQFHVARP